MTDQEIEKSITDGQIIGHHLTNTPEKGEEEKLAEWLKEPSHQSLFEEIADPGFLSQSYHFHKGTDAIHEHELFIKKQQRNKIIRYLRYGIPAAAFVIISLSITLLYNGEEHMKTHTPPYAQNKILPGSSKAVLVLEDNRQIDLSGHQEQISSNGKIVADLQDDRLSYRNKNENPATQDIPHHRLITPIGGEYRLVLADGTKVWLNANSELSYPVSFSGKQREITLHGEAYFEVAPDKSKPFHVHTGQFDVVVTGTAFNVTAYPEENHHFVALAKGGVNIMSGSKLLARLQPGKQIDYCTSDGKYKIGDADLEAVTAWKNGLFLFREEPLSSITRKLGRWYNVEFKIRHGKTEQFYSGTIKRDEPLEYTLNILKLTNEIDFQFKGDREIEVIPIP